MAEHPEEELNSEWADPFKQFPNAIWFDLSVQERGEFYFEYALAASLDPFSLGDEQWALLGAAHRDPEAVAYIAQNTKDGGYAIDVNELLSDENLSALLDFVAEADGSIQRDRYEFGAPPSRLAYYNGFQKPPTFQDNAVAQIAFDVATLFVGGAVIIKGAKLTKLGVGYLARTSGGKAILRAFTRAAPALDDVPTALERFAQFGFAASVYGGGATMYDVYYANTDPEGFVARGEANILKANAQRAGYTFQEAGQAAGDGSLILFDSNIVITDPDGNIITQEELQEQLDAPYQGDNVTSTPTTTRPPSTQEPARPTTIAGTVDEPQYDQRNQTGSTGIVALDSGGTGAGATGEGQTRAEFQAEQFAEERDKRFNADPSLGVPQGFYRGPQDRSQLDADADLVGARGKNRHFTEEALEIRVPTSAVYQSSSIMDQIANWGVFDIIEFQGKAIEAGLIDPKTLFSGTVDGQTINALTTAMTQANINGYGQTFDEAMDNMVEARARAKELYGDEDQPPTWTPSTAYFAPDYATISQNVKGIFARDLGRDPNSWEMDLLADQFRSDHRTEYDQIQAGSKAVFDARGRADESGELEVPGSVQDVDPRARMEEKFDEQFSDELSAKDRWSAVQSKSRNLFGSFDKLSRA